MKIEVNGKEYETKELSYLESIRLEGFRKECLDDDGNIINYNKLAEFSKRLFMASLEITSEDIDKLGIKEGLELQKKLIELSKVEDFQKPVEEKQN